MCIVASLDKFFAVIELMVMITCTVISASDWLSMKRKLYSFLSSFYYSSISFIHIVGANLPNTPNDHHYPDYSKRLPLTSTNTTTSPSISITNPSHPHPTPTPTPTLTPTPTPTPTAFSPTNKNNYHHHNNNNNNSPLIGESNDQSILNISTSRYLHELHSSYLTSYSNSNSSSSETYESYPPSMGTSSEVNGIESTPQGSMTQGNKTQGTPTQGPSSSPSTPFMGSSTTDWLLRFQSDSLNNTENSMSSPYLLRISQDILNNSILRKNSTYDMTNKGTPLSTPKLRLFSDSTQPQQPLLLSTSQPFSTLNSQSSNEYGVHQRISFTQQDVPPPPDVRSPSPIRSSPPYHKTDNHNNEQYKLMTKPVIVIPHTHAKTSYPNNKVNHAQLPPDSQSTPTYNNRNQNQSQTHNQDNEQGSIYIPSTSIPSPSSAPRHPFQGLHQQLQQNNKQRYSPQKTSILSPIAIDKVVSRSQSGSVSQSVSVSRSPSSSSSGYVVNGTAFETRSANGESLGSSRAFYDARNGSFSR